MGNEEQIYKLLRQLAGGQVLLVPADAKVLTDTVIPCEFDTFEVDPDDRSGRTFFKPKLKINTQQS